MKMESLIFVFSVFSSVVHSVELGGTRVAKRLFNKDPCVEPYDDICKLIILFTITL